MGTSVRLFQLFTNNMYNVIYTVLISWDRRGQRGLNTLRGPRSSSFWVPRNLFHHMDKQARTGDTVLVTTSREMTGRTQTLPWWLGGEGVKTTENKIHWPRWWGAENRQSTRLFSSPLNWDQPSPSPAGECLPSTFGSGVGTGNTLTCGEGGGGGPNSDKGTDTVVLLVLCG